MSRILALAAFVLSGPSLAGCMALPDAPQATSAWPAGTPVPLGQPVMAGELAMKPIAVIEDSRCPINARCVWAGRLIVRTRIDGEGWRETANITLGESYGTHGEVVALVSGEPSKRAERETQPDEYRFVYEAR